MRGQGRQFLVWAFGHLAWSGGAREMRLSEPANCKWVRMAPGLGQMACLITTQVEKNMLQTEVQQGTVQESRRFSFPPDATILLKEKERDLYLPSHFTC